MSTINLLPDDYIRRRADRRTNIICVVLFTMVVGAVIGAHTVTDRSYVHTLEVQQRVDSEYATATELIQQMQQLEAQKSQMLDKANKTSSLVELVPRSVVLGVLTNARPPGTGLLEVRLETTRVDAVKVKKMTLTGERRGQGANARTTSALVKVKVMGLAPNDAKVAKYIANLARNRLIDSVDLAFSQEKHMGEVAIREFQFNLVLRNDVDAVDVVKDAGRPSMGPIELKPTEGDKE